MDKKACTRCHKEQPLDRFPRDRKKRDGRAPRCKACSSQVSAEYRAAHLEERRAQERETARRRNERRRVRTPEDLELYGPIRHEPLQPDDAHVTHDVIFCDHPYLVDHVIVERLMGGWIGYKVNRYGSKVRSENRAERAYAVLALHHLGLNDYQIANRLDVWHETVARIRKLLKLPANVQGTGGGHY